jgi:hypothetical protein
VYRQIRDDKEKGVRQTQVAIQDNLNDWRKRPRRKKRRLPNQSIDEVLPISISWLGISEVERLLGCDRSQVYRDLKTLIKIDEALKKYGSRLPGLDKKPKDIGLSRDTIEVLWEFRKLTIERGKSRAQEQIPFKMKEIYDNR